MPSHVLVPFDGTPLSKDALRYACSEFDSATITTLFVVDKATDDTAAIGWGDHPGLWDEWLEERQEHARELFTDAEKIAGEYGVSVQTGVAVGPVAEMVVKAAQEYGADLIVVGLHGQSRLEELLIGSVAKSVIRTSPIPVTTIRESME
ncbi:universal stress protein [Halobellus captivus]|uniref:universal stress protein n=1 Tax=Halobellus captivus TaxID=2592614 RepID=UPI0011A112A2|nr:universal stress protein [Halobellus captivus]